MEELIKFSKEDSVGIATINNPPVNALSRATLEELSHLLDRLDSEGVKALILTGIGPVFVAGADLKELAKIKTPQEAEAATRAGQALFDRIERLPIPVIAAINGFCLGGGNELAMACHIRLASDRARFGQPEISLGIMPGFGGTQRLPRLIGRAQALELLLTGDIIPAKQAYELGLVNKVYGDWDLLKQAKGLAKKITGKGKLAARAILKAVEEGMRLSLAEGQALESKLFSELSKTEDTREGLTAFLEKRQPTFRDR